MNLILPQGTPDAKVGEIIKLAVMAVGARFAEVLLPIVVFPMVTPVLIAGVKGAGVVLGTTFETDPWPWLQFTAAYDLCFGLIGLFLFERMVTE